MFAKVEISTHKILIFLLAVCIFSLSLAYVSQYFFGLKPCILCLYQRVPYFVIVFVSAISLAFLNKEVFRKIAVIACILSLFVNSGVAFYHVGVEKKIFKMTEKCSDSLSSINSLEDLKKAIQAKKITRCDEPEFFFLGLTMAAWNMIFSFGIGVFGVYLLRRNGSPSHLLGDPRREV